MNYRITLMGYENKVKNQLNDVIYISVIDKDLLKGIRRAKSIYHKKYWRLSNISEISGEAEKLSKEALKALKEAFK